MPLDLGLLDLASFPLSLRWDWRVFFQYRFEFGVNPLSRLTEVLADFLPRFLVLPYHRRENQQENSTGQRVHAERLFITVIPNAENQDAAGEHEQHAQHHEKGQAVISKKTFATLHGWGRAHGFLHLQ